MADYNKKEKLVSAQLVGYAYYVFNRKPHHDSDNNKDLYKLELVLTEKDGSPITSRSKKTGKDVNMIERAKELGLILKDPRGTVSGMHVRIKREVKVLKDGSETLPPETKNTKGEDFVDIIGNGSKIQVELVAIPIKKGPYQGKSSAYLNKIVVIDHVPYITDSDEFGFSDHESSQPLQSSTKSDKDEEPKVQQQELDEGEFVEVED